MYKYYIMSTTKPTYNNGYYKNGSKVYGMSQSDRMYELINQKAFGDLSENRRGGAACDSDLDYDNISRCNEVIETNYSRKSGTCYMDEDGNMSSNIKYENGKPTKVEPSSERTDIVAVKTIMCKDNGNNICNDDDNTTDVKWHNQSDRIEPHGGGVDIKYGSYARYLAKKRITKI